MVLLPFLTYNWMPINTMLGILMWLSLVVLLFGSVLLHELGHALTARRFGIHTQDIILTPLGGMARVLSMPRNPKQEIAIAIAGPIVSISLAGLAFLASFPLVFFPFAPPIVHEAVLILFWTNLMLALFNLVPALPMDGGRVLRGILALKRDHLTATRIAARVGRILAVVGGIYAIANGNFTLGLIAVFIYITAGSEVRMAEYRAYDEELRRTGGVRRPFPFGGIPRGRIWTWDTRRGADSTEDNPASGISDATPTGRGERPSWSSEDQQTDNEVIVVGGKAEIIGRKDPN
jgi:Zn-dependent protease